MHRCIKESYIFVCVEHNMLYLHLLGVFKTQIEQADNNFAKILLVASGFIEMQ